MNNSQRSKLKDRCVTKWMAIAEPMIPKAPTHNAGFRGTRFLNTKVMVVNGCCNAPAVVIIGKAISGDKPKKNNRISIKANRPTPSAVMAPQKMVPIKPSHNWVCLKALACPPMGSQCI